MVKKSIPGFIDINYTTRLLKIKGKTKIIFKGIMEYWNNGILE